MARFREMTDATMNVDQRRLADEMRAGPRGNLSAPLHIWLNSPGLGQHAHRLGEYVRFRSSLPKRASEIVILTCAQHWQAQFECWAHERLAREAGVEEKIIEALRAGERPDFANDDEALAYDFATMLLTKKRVSDALFDRAKARFGENGVVDIVGTLGYYSLISLTLNTFEAPVPDGKLPYREPPK